MTRKIAILGGGASSLCAAWDLVHSDPGAYDITVYQVGWRLGGKGASGRRIPDETSASKDCRIEEHGLHFMFGFYENVFRIIREAYAEHYGDPALWQRFFKTKDTAVAMIHFLNEQNTEWAPWTLVDFNDQPLGRLTLLRDFLDRLPDTKLPVADIPWPELAHEPRKETFRVLQPIDHYAPAKPEANLG